MTDYTTKPISEENTIYRAWRESEAYQIPMTEEGYRLTEQRWFGFQAGWNAAKKEMANGEI